MYFIVQNDLIRISEYFIEIWLSFFYTVLSLFNLNEIGIKLFLIAACYLEKKTIIKTEEHMKNILRVVLNYKLHTAVVIII